MDVVGDTWFLWPRTRHDCPELLERLAGLGLSVVPRGRSCLDIRWLLSGDEISVVREKAKGPAVSGGAFVLRN